jgi:hypothetical protein
VATDVILTVQTPYLSLSRIGFKLFFTELLFALSSPAVVEDDDFLTSTAADDDEVAPIYLNETMLEVKYFRQLFCKHTFKILHSYNTCIDTIISTDHYQIDHTTNKYASQTSEKQIQLNCENIIIINNLLRTCL